MGSFAVICCPNGEVAVSESMAAFESWLAGAFPEARVIGRDGIGVRALEWTLGNYSTPVWMDGWINEDRTGIYLNGDPDLMATTALAVRDVFPTATPVAYTEDWQGIPFDLRKVPDARSLADAVAVGNLEFAWRDDVEEPDSKE